MRNLIIYTFVYFDYFHFNIYYNYEINNLKNKLIFVLF